MKALILAAGEGKRMRPLTLSQPKPLLKVGALSLIEHQILRLRAAGISDIVVNVSYLADKIKRFLGDGQRYSVSIQYSDEPEMLETGGAIAWAKERLGDSPFLLVNGDVWIDFDFGQLLGRSYSTGHHLVLVPNPDHNANGDFSLDRQGYVVERSAGPLATYTYSGIGVIHPEVFFEYPNIRHKFPLKEVFDWSISQSKITGEIHEGVWIDVGTPERLDYVQQFV